MLLYKEENKMIKYGKAKITSIGELKDFLKENDRLSYSLKKLASTQESIFRPILLDPDRYLYLRNRAISAYEYFDANDNGDAFPEAELRKSYTTFIGKNITVDHKPMLRIGVVIDSAYIEPVNPEDPRTGNFVENIWAVDKYLVTKLDPRLLYMLVDGKITDTSMGVKVGYSKCSACGAIARTENDYCDHIKYHKLKTIRYGSKSVKVVEICYDLEFFEDSLIRPLSLGGLAGGRGADRNAKILEIFGYINNAFSTFKTAADYKPTIDKYVTKQEKDFTDLTTDPLPNSNKPDAQVALQVEEEKKGLIDNVEKFYEEKYDYINSLKEDLSVVKVDEIPNLFSAIPNDDLNQIYNTVMKLFSSVISKAAGNAPEDMKELFKDFVLSIRDNNMPFYLALINAYQRYTQSIPQGFIKSKKDFDNTIYDIEVPDGFDLYSPEGVEYPELDKIDINELDEFEPIENVFDTPEVYEVVKNTPEEDEKIDELDNAFMDALSEVHGEDETEKIEESDKKEEKLDVEKIKENFEREREKLNKKEPEINEEDKEKLLYEILDYLKKGTKEVYGMDKEERLGVKEIYIQIPEESYLGELLLEIGSDEEAVGSIALEIAKLALRSALLKISKVNDSFAESYARMRDEETLDKVIEDLALRTVEYEIEDDALELYVDFDGIKKYLSDYGITDTDVKSIYEMFEYLSDKGFPALDLYLRRELESVLADDLEDYEEYEEEAEELGEYGEEEEELDEYDEEEESEEEFEELEEEFEEETEELEEGKVEEESEEEGEKKKHYKLYDLLEGMEDF